MKKGDILTLPQGQARIEGFPMLTGFRNGVHLIALDGTWETRISTVKARKYAQEADTMTPSATQAKIERQCRQPATIDPVMAVHLLRKAQTYVSRNASIGAQELATQIKEFVASCGVEA
jgi:hypothetical protein